MKDAYKLPGSFLLYTYRIHASYTTRKGNAKTRYFLIDGVTPRLAETCFYHSMSSHNENNPKKPFLNVEVLEIEEVGRKMVYSHLDGSLSSQSL